MSLDAILFKIKTIIVDCIPYNVEYFYFPETDLVPKFGYIACASNGHQVEKIFDFQQYSYDLQQTLEKIEQILDRHVIKDISEILAKRVRLLATAPVYIREAPDSSPSLSS